MLQSDLNPHDLHALSRFLWYCSNYLWEPGLHLRGLLVASLMILQKGLFPSISSASWWALPSAKC